MLIQRTFPKKKSTPIKKLGLIIIDEEHDVFFVTSTWSDNLKKKSNFLKRCFVGIDIEDRLIKANHKEIVKGDVMIDDYSKNLKTSICEENVCIAYPWNEDWTGLRFNTVAEWIKFRYNVDV